jgi:hypothetical protein
MKRSPKARLAALAATSLLVCGLGAAEATATGGLSVSPGIFKHAAAVGGLGAMEVSNTSGKPLQVTLTPRPWLQSSSGSVSANRRGMLGKVRLRPGSFRLAPGATRRVGVSLSRPPARGSLYGALEVTGAPRRRGGKGIRIAYRLVTGLRLYPRPGTQTLSARAGRLIQHGTTRHGSLLMAVRNTGNTIVPIGASVNIKGNGHSLTASGVPKAILPGATVNLPLTRLRGTLPRGRYRVKVRLSQGGHPLGTITRHGVRLR